MIYTGEPLDDFYAYDDEEEARIAMLPRCGICDEPLIDDYCFEIEGDHVCENCLHKHFKVRVANI